MSQTPAQKMLEMSDEDFNQLSGPESSDPGSDAQGTDPVEKEEETPPLPTPSEEGGDKAAEDPAEGGDPGAAVVETEEEKLEPDPANPTPEGEDQSDDDAGSEKDPKDPDVAGAGDKVQEDPEQEQLKYEQFYSKIMTPFKANGKLIKLDTPEDAIALMQMGANYTRKMQDIQPHRKLLMMLQANDLLDENKLSFFIDLEKKNPEAIKKLIKDSGIDPLEIDTTTDPNYSAGDHKLTDEEVTFRTALEDLTSNPDGKETLSEINGNWDEASKEVLWAQPEMLQIIHLQRETGVYTRIAEEIDRQRTLGKIAPGTPFLQAYKTVGDQLLASNGFADLASQAPEPEIKDPASAGGPKILDTRAATPKKPVDNDDKASAASPSRSTPGKAKPLVNPLAMSDEEFLKLDQFKGL